MFYFPFYVVKSYFLVKKIHVLKKKIMKKQKKNGKNIFNFFCQKEQ
jgi:hypothetical protein